MFLNILTGTVQLGKMMDNFYSELSIIGHYKHSQANLLTNTR